MVDGAVQVTGVAQLRRTMRAAGEDLSQFNRLNHSVGNIIVTRAKHLVPVGPDVNGHIGDTIRASSTRTAVVIKAGNARHPYGPPLHWGWPTRGIKGQPFLTDAAQQTQDEWLELYFEGVQEIIENIKGA